MKKISIIIPVYNTQRYLHNCINSILCQKMDNLEIICVDDGSNDGSSEILDNYAQKDRRVKVFHQENRGLVAARKAGINLASGEYAGYVDSDDWIEPNMYEDLYKAAISTNADIVTCGYFLEGNYTTIHLDNLDEGLYLEKRMGYLRDNTIYNLKNRETGLRGGLWCKLFKTGILRKVQNMIPENITIAEDKVCLIRYIMECSSAYVLKKPLYHWVIRGDSMSHASKNTYLLKIHYVYQYLTSLYQHPNFSKLMRSQAEIYIIELLFLGINKRMGFQNTNLLWIDPYWMANLPINSKIILYGAGELGEKYRKQLDSRPDLMLVCCVDPQYEKLTKDEFIVEAPENVWKYDYDYIIITIKNRKKADQIKENLLIEGVSEEKIVWFEQPEAYWKYIEAENMGRGMEGIDDINEIS